MPLNQKYQQLINDGHLHFDEAQNGAIQALGLLSHHLTNQPKTKLKSNLIRLPWLQRF